MTAVGREAGSLRRGAARAAFAFVSVEIVTRVLTVLLAVATARALGPRDVGLLGLAGIIVGALSVIASGADTAGVTSHGRGSDIRYALGAVVIRGGATGILVGLALIALPGIGHLLGSREGVEAEVGVLVRLLLWQLGLELAATFPRVLLQRRLDLAWVAWANLMQIVTHVSLALALLWNGFGAVGVVAACLVGAGVNAAILWLRLTGSWSPDAEGAIRGDVSGQVLITTVRIVAARFVGYLNGRADNLLVAGVLGPTAMSLYGIAWTASRQPIILLSQALDSVLTPTLAYVQDDRERIRSGLREALDHYYILLAPLCAWLFVSAPFLVAEVLGAEWLPLVPCLRVMSVTVLLGPILAVCHSLLMATGRAHLIGLAACAQLVTLLLLVAPLSRRWGILGAAFGDLGSMMVLTLGLWAACRLAKPEIKWSIVREGSAPVFAAIVVGAAALIVSGQFNDGFLRFLVEMNTIAFGYVGVLWWMGERKRMLRLLAIVLEIVRSRELVARAGSSN